MRVQRAIEGTASPLTEDDCTLFLHRVVPQWALAVEHRPQLARLRVPGLDGPVVVGVALDHRRDELALDGGVLGVGRARLAARPQPVLAAHPPTLSEQHEDTALT